MRACVCARVCVRARVFGQDMVLWKGFHIKWRLFAYVIVNKKLPPSQSFIEQGGKLPLNLGTMT